MLHSFQGMFFLLEVEKKNNLIDVVLIHNDTCTKIRLLLSLKRCTSAFTTKCREFRALKKVVARKIPHGDFQKLACMILYNIH